MKMNIKVTNIEVSEPSMIYLGKKLEHLEKLLAVGVDDMVMVDIELAKDTLHHKKGKIYKAEFNFKIGRNMLRAVGQELSIHEAIDSAKDEMSREIKRLKGTFETRARAGGRKLKESRREI